MASLIRNKKLFCTCCGGEHELVYPMPIKEFSNTCKAFDTLHKNCKQTYVEPKPDQDLAVKEKAMFWLNYGEKGMSSETMWNCLMGNKNFSVNHPYDPSDFRRCHSLLEMVPEWRLRLDEVSKLSKQWKNLTKNWDKLTEMLLELQQMKSGQTNGMYDFMQTLIRIN